MNWRHIQDLLAQTQHVADDRIHRALGAVEWLLLRGEYNHWALREVPDPDELLAALRREFQDLPTDAELEQLGREALDRIVAGLAAILCSDRAPSRLVRIAIEQVIGEGAGTQTAVGVALLMHLVVPPAAIFAAGVLGSWLVSRGLDITCDSLRRYVNEH